MLDVTKLRYAPVIDKRQLHDLRGFTLRRQLVRRSNVPPWCFVPAGRALKWDAATLEMQQRIVTVETTNELPNLVGNHCAETPFAALTPVWRPSMRCRFPEPRNCDPDISREMPRARSNA